MRTVIFFQSVLIIIVFIFIAQVTVCDTQSFEKKQVNVVFRFDDYSALSSTDMELIIIDAFRKNEASITFGVIPFVCAGDIHDPSPNDVVPLTSMKADILKTAVTDGILDVALHGYSHQTIKSKQFTEFSGLDYNKQLERLAKGKEVLEGIIDAPVTTFVPPWNTYDVNTLRALKELGLTTLSASKDGEATENPMLNYLPATCDLTRLRDAVKKARSSSETNPLIVVLFHEYDFQEANDKRDRMNYQEFYDLLGWLKSQEDIRLLSISQAIKVINDLSATRFMLNNRIYLLSNLLPILLQEEESTILYQESARLSKTLLRVVGFYLTIASIGAFVSFMLGFLVFRKYAFITNIGTFGSIALFAMIIIYALHDRQVYLRGMMVSACLVGASIGVFMCFLSLRKRRLLDRNKIEKRKT